MSGEELKLLPCPFCGDEYVELKAIGAISHGYAVECLNCETVGPKNFDTNAERAKRSATYLWNARAHPIPEQPQEGVRERVAVAIRQATGCGLMADGTERFCDFCDCFKAADAAIAALHSPMSELQRMDWQPIETFVGNEEYEDGILICDASKPTPSVGVARFLGNKWMGFDHSFGVECFYPTPTHWMPLPAAPSSESKP